MQPKPEGYGDNFTAAKCGHCNGIQVHGIHAQGNSAKSFALATKIIVRTEKASGLLTGQQASKSAGLFVR